MNRIRVMLAAGACAGAVVLAASAQAAADGVPWL